MKDELAFAVMYCLPFTAPAAIIIFPKDVATIAALQPGYGKNSVELAYIEKQILHHAKSR